MFMLSMKPNTYKQMKDRFFENVVNMENENTLQDEYDIMTGENETIEWIAEVEGKGKDFKKWTERCYIEVQAREEGI